MDQEETIHNILSKIPLFTELSEESANLINSKITLEYFPKNQMIFSQGDEGDCMYIIKKGLVKIFQGSTDNVDDQVQIAVLPDNSFFGEMALVSETTRNASAITVDDTEVFKLKKDDFYMLVESNPTLAEQVSSEFISRIKENMRNTDFKQ